MIKSLIKKLNAFANDGDRGPGHGITQGAYYGFIFLPITTLGVWPTLILSLLNHARVLYQEIWVEGWLGKYSGSKEKGDFWFDCFMRPLQTDLVLLLGFLNGYHLLWLCPLILFIGYKKKNQWPGIFFWKG